MATQQESFGNALRTVRINKGYSLRRFAATVGLSPTYLSQVEQGNIAPPTADRVKQMAELLSVNSDEWMALAGRVADDLPGIINEKPTVVPDLLRALHGLTIDQIRKLQGSAEQMKKRARKQA